MPRFRKLHTKTVESLDLNEMPDDTHRLFWVLLPTQLCREGRAVDNPAWLKSHIFPLRQDIDISDVMDIMRWLEVNKMIVRYEVDDRNYFYVPTFHHYQGDCSREAESNYPPPGRRPRKNKSRATHEQVTSKSEKPKTKAVKKEKDKYFHALIPDTLALNGLEFNDTWEEWVNYRIQKKKALAETTAKKQLNKLAKYGAEVAIWTLEESMTNGWVGLFPDKYTEQSSKPQTFHQQKVTHNRAVIEKVAQEFADDEPA